MFLKDLNAADIFNSKSCVSLFQAFRIETIFTEVIAGIEVH